MAMSIAHRIAKIHEQIQDAVGAVSNDPAASEVLKAVVGEFDATARKGTENLTGADERTIRDHVVEIEQAADSAKRAVQAESALGEPARAAILAAHDELSALKHELSGMD